MALLLCMLSPPAWADDPALTPPKDPAAHSHFTKGNRLYRVRKIDEAVAAYQAGAVIEPVPVFDYNLGQCYRKLGKPADALWHYERFLRNGRPEGELQALVTGFVRQMREELEREAMTHPPTPAPPAPSSPAERATPAGPFEPAPMPAAELASSTVAPGASWYSDRLGWGLVAGGAAAAGVALYLQARAFGLRDDADANLTEDRRTELREASRARGIGAAVVGVGSAALIAAGAIKLALRPGAPSRARATSWTVDISGRGVAVLGRF